MDGEGNSGMNGREVVVEDGGDGWEGGEVTLEEDEVSEQSPGYVEEQEVSEGQLEQGDPEV